MVLRATHWALPALLPALCPGPRCNAASTCCRARTRDSPLCPSPACPRPTFSAQTGSTNGSRVPIVGDQWDRCSRSRECPHHLEQPMQGFKGPPKGGPSRSKGPTMEEGAYFEPMRSKETACQANSNFFKMNQGTNRS